MKINRRKFLTGTAAVTALTFLPRAEATASISQDSYATLIDLKKCDGCVQYDEPKCVASCRSGRSADFPNPPPEELRDYWPQKKHEDWSDKKQLNDRFTPYNWIFVQKVQVDGMDISIPRRCMHCDNPPCAKLCPFGVKHKTAEGPVYIDKNLCFGGAKCRSVCPWKVPQRQAGVGLYTLWQKYLPVGGGVMYKCDLCRDRLAADQQPFCIGGCPQNAMEVGKRSEIFAKATSLKKQYQGDLYGLSENGGTSTVYVSPVPFSKINKALLSQAKTGAQRPVPMHQPENVLASQKPWAKLSLVAPIIGVAAALGLAGKNNREKQS